jgi:hypothetical protein
MLALFNIFNIAKVDQGSAEVFEKKFLETSGNYTLREAYCDSEPHFIYLLSFKPDPVYIPDECASAGIYSVPTYGKIFSYEQLVLMAQKYQNDYDSIKNEFGMDFNLNIKDETGTPLFSMTKTKALGTDVYAKNFRIKIFDGLKVINAIVNVQTW